ncbi:hypothetical protein JCGZ_06384 [Jatropha curcas]|uniref:Uncharacterized protein n=1 Tax=Jatropha curcas TaxID=180498 RepID=A0A067KP18_JATCU|nr:hypothetical protein JCGZ_06384 [Jatropha curcas]
MTDPTSSTPVERPSQAGPSWLAGPSRAPRAILKATGPLHPDLASLRLPYGISYFVPDSPPALRGVSLESVDRPALPSEDITEVLEPTGPLPPDLASLRLPYSISYFVPDSPPAFREVSLEGVDRTVLPSEDITEVPVGLVNQMMELILGLQQEVAMAWTQIAFDDQRSRRPRC